MCKTVQYMIVVTCLGSVYTLVLMSLDRFLAVVHPISSMSIRTERNALMYVKLKRQSGKLFPFLFFLYFRATLLAWFFIFTTAIPTAICHGEVTYMHKGDNHTACLFLSEQGYNHSLFQVRSQLGSSYTHTLHPSYVSFPRKLPCCWCCLPMLLITPPWTCLNLFLFERLMFAAGKKAQTYFSLET